MAHDDNYDNLLELLDVAGRLLHSDGIVLDDSKTSQLHRHVDLIREWNTVVGVVSKGDADQLWQRHVVDSLSLAAVVHRLGFAAGHLLDIGSGGGFPAIPIKIVLPQLRITLVERSEKKVGFLRKAVGALGLDAVTIHAGEFLLRAAELSPDVITARAVETPRKIASRIPPFLDLGAVFLSQSGESLGDGYQAERITDAWTDSGLRRGVLDVVRRV